MRRCLALVIASALLVLAPLLVGSQALAQDMTCSTSPSVLDSSCADQGLAFAAAWATANAQAAKSNAGSSGWCAGVKAAGSTSFTAYVTPCSSPGPQYETRTRRFTALCSSRPEELGWEGGSTAASVNACHNGCMYSSSLDPAGVAGFSYLPTGGTCTDCTWSTTRSRPTRSIA